MWSPRFCPHPPRTCWGKLWWAHRLIQAAGGGEAQEAACGGSKVANPAILSRLPGPVLAVCLQDCKVSTLGRALHRLDQAQATYRAAARNEWQFAAVAKLRLSRVAARCAGNRPLYT